MNTTRTLKTDKRLFFDKGDELDAILSSINSCSSKLENILPFKDAYMTLLKFKYNWGTTDVFPLLVFLKKDFANFLIDSDMETHNFSRVQMNTLQEFVKVVKKKTSNKEDICDDIWILLDKTFHFNRHERFTKQDLVLFNMCYDVLQKLD